MLLGISQAQALNLQNQTKITLLERSDRHGKKIFKTVFDFLRQGELILARIDV